MWMSHIFSLVQIRKFSTFCTFDIFFFDFLSFDILSFRRLLFDVFPSTLCRSTFFFRCFASSIFCLFDILLFDVLTFDLLPPISYFYLLHLSIFDKFISLSFHIHVSLQEKQQQEKSFKISLKEFFRLFSQKYLHADYTQFSRKNKLTKSFLHSFPLFFLRFSSLL